LRGRLLPGKGRAKLGGIESVLGTLEELDRLTIVGCGSAYYAGLLGKHYLETYAGLPTEVDLASEYRYRHKESVGQEAVLAVSQSGETADTLASLRDAKERGLFTLGLVNVVGSTIARETDAGVYNHAGPEIAVASTKAFLSQVTVFVLLTLLLGRQRGILSAEDGEVVVRELRDLPKTLQTFLKEVESPVQAVAKRYAVYDNAMFIGRHFHAPIAAEGALKLKEVAYVHAEAYPSGELKHGPIALLDEQFPVIALAPKDAVYEKMRSNIEEVRARRAPVLVLASEGDTLLANLADDVIRVPHAHPMLQPLLMTVPLQLLAYHIGIARGLNVDRPRNLAKSVTVE